MPTQLSLANNALLLIRQQTLASLSSTTDPHTLVILAQWDLALEEFLAETPWNWAKARDTLTASSPAPTFGWTNRFALPSDFVSVVAINEDTSFTPGDQYEIESGYLYTDANVSSEPASIFLEYIAKPTDSALDTFLGRMEPKAANAFVLLLASKLAPAITQEGLSLTGQLLGLYERALAAARTHNANQNRLRSRFPYQQSPNRSARFNFRNT